MDILVYVVEAYAPTVDGGRAFFAPCSFLTPETAAEYKREVILAGASHATIHTAIEHI